MEELKEEREERKSIRNFANQITDYNLRNVCLDLADIIPVGITANILLRDLCDGMKYGRNFENWVLRLASRVDLSSDVLSKIKSTCDEYLPTYGPIDELIKTKLNEELADTLKRAERSLSAYEIKRRRNVDEEKEKLYMKYTHEENMQRNKYIHEETILDKKLNNKIWNYNKYKNIILKLFF